MRPPHSRKIIDDFMIMSNLTHLNSKSSLIKQEINRKVSSKNTESSNFPKEVKTLTFNACKSLINTELIKASVFC